MSSSKTIFVWLLGGAVIAGAGIGLFHLINPVFGGRGTMVLYSLAFLVLFVAGVLSISLTKYSRGSFFVYATWLFGATIFAWFISAVASSLNFMSLPVALLWVAPFVLLLLWPTILSYKATYKQIQTSLYLSISSVMTVMTSIILFAFLSVGLVGRPWGVIAVFPFVVVTAFVLVISVLVYSIGLHIRFRNTRSTEDHIAAENK